jgi:hypothetical protein
VSLQPTESLTYVPADIDAETLSESSEGFDAVVTRSVKSVPRDYQDERFYF